MCSSRDTVKLEVNVWPWSKCLHSCSDRNLAISEVLFGVQDTEPNPVASQLSMAVSAQTGKGEFGRDRRENKDERESLTYSTFYQS